MVKNTDLTKGKLKVKEKNIEKALQEVKAKRKKKKIRLYILFAVLIVTFLVMKYWETTEKQEIREMAMEQTPSLRVDETSPNIAAEESAGDILDEGTPCRNHEYILSPGTSEILKFEIKLQREVVQLAHLLKNKIEYNDISIENSFAGWEEQGITADIYSYEVENLPDKTNVWVVQAGELLGDLRSRNDAVQGEMSDSFAKITGYIAKTTRFKVDFFDEYYGVISTLGRYYYTEAKVGELAESDIIAKLGGTLTLPYVYREKSYHLPLEKREVEKVMYFLNLNINITLPENIDKEILAKASSFVVKAGEVDEIKFVLKLSFDSKNKEFHISGPAISADCYKPGEINKKHLKHFTAGSAGENELIK